MTVGGEGCASFARWTDTGAPWIARVSHTGAVPAGADASFEATPASGYVGLTYQWRRDGAFLADGPGGASEGGGTVVGAALRTLTIIGAAPSDTGTYVCVVSNACGQSESSPAELVVRCAADFDSDGGITSQDFFDFLAAFFAGVPAADFNDDGSVNSQDFFDFLGAFFSAC